MEGLERFKAKPLLLTLSPLILNLHRLHSLFQQNFKSAYPTIHCASFFDSKLKTLREVIMYTIWFCKTAFTSTVLTIPGVALVHTFFHIFLLALWQCYRNVIPKASLQIETYFLIFYGKSTEICYICIKTELLQLCKDYHATRTFCWQWYFRQSNLLDVQNVGQSLFKCFDLLSPWTHSKIIIIKNNYGESRLHSSTVSLMGMWMPLNCFLLADQVCICVVVTSLYSFRFWERDKDREGHLCWLKKGPFNLQDNLLSFF